jgi:N-acetyl-alpha-D-glucosaminyl L-malate synthase BshA
VATELALELGRKGHQVHVISYATPFRLRGFPENVFFHEVDLSGAYPLFEYFPYSLALSVKQHEVAIREDLDILHVHYAIPHATAGFVAREMARPQKELKLITTLHGTDITLVGQEQSFFSVTKFSIEQSDAVTAVSQYLKDETNRAFGCAGCEIEVIPNFINLEEYYPLPEGEARHHIVPDDRKVVIHISNFRELKRVPTVVQAFAKIREKIPAVLVLVGDGPSRQETEAEVARLGLEDDVLFLGKMDVVAELLRSADVCLMPSSSESFGLVAHESMACGVPVVASRIGGLPDLIGDVGAGTLVELGDVDGFANAALEFLTDDKRLKQASDAAVKRAAGYASNDIVSLYEDLYARVLAS